MTEDEVLALFDSCSNVGRWGPHDELGTLNHITSARRLEALRGLRSGRVVALGTELPVRRSRQVPAAAELRPRYSAVDAHDELVLRIHGYEVTHVDAPGHVDVGHRLQWGPIEEGDRVPSVVAGIGVDVGDIQQDADTQAGDPGQLCLPFVILEDTLRSLRSRQLLVHTGSAQLSDYV